MARKGGEKRGVRKGGEKRCLRKGVREKVARKGGERKEVETQEKVASRRALCSLAAAALARRRRCTRISRTT